MESYEFNYYTQKAKFEIDGDKINYKIGIKKDVLKISQIAYFRKFQYQDYDYLIIRYKNENGKLKNLKVFGNKNSQGLNSFLFRLSELLPEKDLSNKPAKEARKILKTSNIAKIGFWGAVIVISVILFFIFRGVFNSIEDNLPIIIIGGIVVLILIVAFLIVYFQGKNQSKDWE